MIELSKQVVITVVPLLCKRYKELACKLQILFVHVHLEYLRYHTNTEDL